MATETLFVKTGLLNVRPRPTRTKSRAVGTLMLDDAIQVDTERVQETPQRIWRQIVDGPFATRFAAEVFDGEVLLSADTPRREHGGRSLFPPALLGLHANSGGWQPGDAELAAFRENRIGIATINADQRDQAENTVGSLRGAGVQHFAVRATASGAALLSPDAFVNTTREKLEQFRNAIGADNFYVQVHNEPNLNIEGWKSAWQDGQEFAAWFIAVARRYRELFPGVKIGFSPMSPGGFIIGGNVERMAEGEFIQGAGAAIAASDWVAVHVYWRNPDASDLQLPLSDWNHWFGGKPILGTEVGPIDSVPVTAQAVRNVHAKFQGAGIAACIWLAHHMSESDPWRLSSWTFHNLRLF